MGGAINVAIRLRDGRTICQERWTNQMPRWFQHPKMFSGDEEHVLEYINLTRDNDFIANPCAPGLPMPVRNSEYGLIVWDYVTNTILDNNGYSSPVIFDPIHTGGDMIKDNFVICAEAGLIRHRVVRYHRTEKRKLDETTTDNLPPGDALRMGQEASERDSMRWRLDPRPDIVSYDQFIVDCSPMTYHAFNYDDTKAMRAKLREIGFPTTVREGLNAALPKPPKPRQISKQEVEARELFREWKKSDDGASYRGIAFDDAGDEIRQRFMSAAANLLLDPDTYAKYNLERLLGSVSTITIIGADKK